MCPVDSSLEILGFVLAYLIGRFVMIYNRGSCYLRLIDWKFISTFANAVLPQITAVESYTDIKEMNRDFAALKLVELYLQCLGIPVCLAWLFYSQISFFKKVCPQAFNLHNMTQMEEKVRRVW